MITYSPILRDVQQDPVIANCKKCNGEIYANPVMDESGNLYHKKCLKEQEANDHDAEVVLSVMEAFDRILKEYLADGVRDVVWNKVCDSFPAVKAGEPIQNEKEIHNETL